MPTPAALAARLAAARRPAARATAVVALALIATAGCDGAPRAADGDGAPRDSAAADTATPATGNTDGDTAGSATGDTAGDTAGAWVATPTGVGPVRVGMTLDEVRAALGADVELGVMVETCAHAELPGAPGRVLAMFVDGRVARVEVLDSLVATDRGARVGDTESRVDSLYGGRVRVEPHKYTDGHYLVVVPGAPADTLHRIVFETDGRRVTTYRAGTFPMVAWVEGCL